MRFIYVLKNLESESNIKILANLGGGERLCEYVIGKYPIDIKGISNFVVSYHRIMKELRMEL